MTAGNGYWADVRVSSDSPVNWPPGIGIPDVIVTYHWLHPSGETYDFLGLETRLPHALRPGEAASLPPLVRASRMSSGVGAVKKERDQQLSDNAGTSAGHLPIEGLAGDDQVLETARSAAGVGYHARYRGHRAPP